MMQYRQSLRELAAVGGPLKVRRIVRVADPGQNR
jgi:hypothetical protein